MFVIFLSTFLCNIVHAVQPDIDSNLRCLSIDGGGLRGAFAISILERIYDNYGDDIHTLFGAGMTGTSTGALIVLGYG